MKFHATASAAFAVVTMLVAVVDVNRQRENEVMTRQRTPSTIHW